MSWDPKAKQGFEHRKIRWEIVPYTRGKGLDLGCGMQKAFPHFIGVDNCTDTDLFGHPIQPDIRGQAQDLSIFASGSLDFCFSSHLLEHLPYEQVPQVLKEWMRVIKPGGHLVLYLPDEDQYPNVGEAGSNSDHKWNVNQKVVLEAMPDGFDLIDYQVRSEEDEYSLYFVFRKGEGREESYRKKVKPTKTIGVIRYGAFGDLMQASSVFAGLKKQGWHVTLFSSPPGCDVVKHDPHIDHHFIQDKDQVRNQDLGEYWAYWRKRFDKFVNLSESVEGTFLAMPGRVQHEWPPALRHKHMNLNYLQHQHELCGIPDEIDIRFFATEEEKAWAKSEREKMGKTVLLWQLSGSSRMHKTYPYLDEIVARLMISYPEVDVVMTGGPECVELEEGWENEPRVHRTSGKWTIRKTLSFLEVADVIVGAETGVLNAAACLPQPKIVFLSHSTRNNLTRDWTNTIALSAPHVTCPGRGNDEAPACHQLHYTWEHCKKGEKKGVAVCMEEINPALTWEAVQQAILTGKAKKPSLSLVA